MKTLKEKQGLKLLAILLLQGWIGSAVAATVDDITCKAQIKDGIYSFATLKNYVAKHTKCGETEPKDLCMVYDIDNTILTTEPNMGSDSWMAWNEQLADTDPNKLKNWGNPGQNGHAFEGALRYFIHYRSTEVMTLNTVNYFKDTLHHPSIALTARDFPSYYSATVQELSYNKFDFSNNYIGDSSLPENTIVLHKNTRGSEFKAYYQGVYYAAGDDKGLTLLELIKSAREKTNNPTLCSQVVFIDNAEHNVDNVYNAFTANTSEKFGIIALLYHGYDSYLTPTKSDINHWKLGKSIDNGGESQSENIYKFIQYIN